MEVHTLSVPLQHRGAQVVVEQSATDPAEEGEGTHVTPQEARQRLVEEEFQVQRPGVTERHHEAAQLPFRTAHSDPTEVGPVHLSLLSTKAAQAQEGFLVDRAHNSDPTAQLPYRTRVATHPDHLEQPCGAQPGMLAQRLLDEFLVRVDRARARRWRAAWGVRQRSLHRFRMQPQLGRDRPQLPVFGVVKLANPGDQAGVDHVSLPQGRPSRPGHTPRRPDQGGQTGDCDVAPHLLPARPVRRQAHRG